MSEMRLYAVRDRLIDYFMVPFAAPGDKEVMQSLANTINQGAPDNAISQAPHHFELWTLGRVTEDGHLVPERSLVCDCASLVRRDLRDKREPGDRPPTGTPGSLPTTPSNAQGAA